MSSTNDSADEFCHPVEPVLIERPNELKVKVGGSLDPSLVSKAESAVTLMSTNFQQWLDDVVRLMIEARGALGAQTPLTRAATTDLYTKALEVKSLGETYGYALVTRFARSLCRLLIRLQGDQAAPQALVDAHIDAIRAALKEGMKTADHPVGTLLAAELEQQVERYFIAASRT